mmetsp:Transcript_34298/g.67433  ORF Transcript_34298/g.67433 Transcript_34298/m.67433 type:complete len:258 (-) Transcript_34298:400-1173(-)
MSIIKLSSIASMLYIASTLTMMTEALPVANKLRKLKDSGIYKSGVNIENIQRSLAGNNDRKDDKDNKPGYSNDNKDESKDDSKDDAKNDAKDRVPKTDLPTSKPTLRPTEEPSSHSPSSYPSNFPSTVPTISYEPSKLPTPAPTKKPTSSPTKLSNQGLGEICANNGSCLSFNCYKFSDNSHGECQCEQCREYGCSVCDGDKLETCQSQNNMPNKCAPLVGYGFPCENSDECASECCVRMFGFQDTCGADSWWKICN